MTDAVKLHDFIKSGELIESKTEMTLRYCASSSKRAPSINAFMTGIAIIQDELAHAHIAASLTSVESCSAASVTR